jgi:hypothetical protein
MADLLEYADQLRVAGRPTRAEAQVQLAAAAQTCPPRTATSTASAPRRSRWPKTTPTTRSLPPRAEWGRRQFINVTDSLD